MHTPTRSEPSDDCPQSLLVEVELELDETELERRMRALFELLDQAGAEACVSLVDDAAIAELNRDYRGVSEATDVLAFAMRDGEGPFFEHDPLGDVIISVETARRMVASAEHRERVGSELALPKLEWTLLDELSFLMIHGVLHLLGWDHAEPDEEQRMKAREAELYLALRAP